MDVVEANKTIAARFIDRWPAESLAAVGAEVAYTVDNVVKPEGAALFARLAIISLGEEQMSLGPVGRRRYQSEGVIEVRLSCGINRGRLELDQLAGAVRRIYRGQRLRRGAREHGVVCHATEVAELRRDAESPGRWIITCSTPFEYTDVG